MRESKLKESRKRRRRKKGSNYLRSILPLAKFFK